MTVTEYGNDWWTQAACLSADPELFFPISSAGPARAQVDAAKAICGGCEVRPECLSFAVATGQLHGVWGGMSADERHGMGRPATGAARGHGKPPRQTAGARAGPRDRPPGRTGGRPVPGMTGAGSRLAAHAEGPAAGRQGPREALAA
jgi:WhiB family redox-sensing transcriptional regulator